MQRTDCGSFLDFGHDDSAIAERVKAAVQQAQSIEQENQS